MTVDSTLVYTTESPAITAAEIARRTVTETMVANAARLMRDRLDSDEE